MCILVIKTNSSSPSHFTHVIIQVVQRSSNVGIWRSESNPAENGAPWRRCLNMCTCCITRVSCTSTRMYVADRRIFVCMITCNHFCVRAHNVECHSLYYYNVEYARSIRIYNIWNCNIRLAPLSPITNTYRYGIFRRAWYGTQRSNGTHARTCAKGQNRQNRAY